MKKLFAITVVIFALITLFSFASQKGFDLKASVARGKEVYLTQCITCHMEQGEGIEGVYPPLAKSDYLVADKNRSIQQILYGASGEMKVNGVTYAGEMAGFDLTDQEVSDVLNYVLNSWGNKVKPVKPEEVKALRK